MTKFGRVKRQECNIIVHKGSWWGTGGNLTERDRLEDLDVKYKVVQI